MSGHSKWAQIKRKKAVTDAKRGAVFSKIAKEIMVATKLGGPNPESNFRLRFAIDKAKANLVPQNNIQKAIEKASGQGKEGSNIEDIIYEGYGPGGAAILILCTTDNKKRTVGDLRNFFTSHKGKLGESGSVSWMFERQGEIRIEKSSFSNQDELYELALVAGGEDIDFEDVDQAVIITKPEELEKVLKNITKKIKVSESKITYRPKEYIEVTDIEQAKNLIALLDEIEDHEDVQEVCCNFDIKVKV